MSEREREKRESERERECVCEGIDGSNRVKAKEGKLRRKVKRVLSCSWKHLTKTNGR